MRYFTYKTYKPNKNFPSIKTTIRYISTFTLVFFCINIISYYFLQSNAYAQQMSPGGSSLQEGIKLYKEGKYEKAIEELEKAIELLKDDPENKWEAHFIKGLCHHILGEDESFENEMRNAIKASKHRIIDSTIYSPKIITKYKKIVQDIEEKLKIEEEKKRRIKKIKRWTTPKESKSKKPEPPCDSWYCKWYWWALIVAVIGGGIAGGMAAGGGGGGGSEATGPGGEDNGGGDDGGGGTGGADVTW